LLFSEHEGPAEVVGRSGVPHRDTAAENERLRRLNGGNLKRHLRSELDLVACRDSCHSGTMRSALWMSQPARFSRKS
jgi:hypothetical protein